MQKPWAAFQDRFLIARNLTKIYIKKKKTPKYILCRVPLIFKKKTTLLSDL